MAGRWNGRWQGSADFRWRNIWARDRKCKRWRHDRRRRRRGCSSATWPRHHGNRPRLLLVWPRLLHLGFHGDGWPYHLLFHLCLRVLSSHRHGWVTSSSCSAIFAWRYNNVAPPTTACRMSWLCVPYTTWPTNIFCGSRNKPHYRSCASLRPSVYPFICLSVLYTSLTHVNRKT